MKGPIQSLEVTYLVHATEDPEKIRESVARVLGHEIAPDAEALEGHFGNPILRARSRLTGTDAEKTFGNLVKGMPRPVVDELASDIGSYLDEHSALFIRLDKQELVSGRVALGSADPVRVKVKPRAFLVEGRAARFYLGLLGRG